MEEVFFFFLIPFPNDRILDLTKLKIFADDKLNAVKMMIYVFNWVENTVGTSIFASPTAFSKDL